MPGINSNTKLMLHLNGINGQTSTIDSSPSAHSPIIFKGTAQLDTTPTNVKFGSAGLFLDGNSDSLKIADSTDWDVVGVTTEDYLIDFWVKHASTSHNGEFYCTHATEPLAGGSFRWILLSDSSDGEFRFIVVNSAITLSLKGGLISDTNYHHLALIKIGSSPNADYALYIDGQQTDYISSNQILNITGPLYIGENGDSPLNPNTTLNGNLDELRIQKSNDFNVTVAASDPGGNWMDNSGNNLGIITVPISEYSPDTPPDPPTSLIATTISSSQIDLSWVAPIDDGGSSITGYQIERESPIGGGFSIIISDTGNTNITFSDIGLDGNTQFNYRVSAINIEGVGNFSNEANDTTLVVIFPKFIISRSSSDLEIKDRLINNQIGINHGEVTNNITTLEEIFFIRHDGINPIQNLKIFLDGLSEILQWADDNAGDGLLLDTNNNGTFDVNFKTGIGDSLVNAINLGDINPAEEKIIVIKIKVPSGESNEGIRNFNLKYNFDFTS